MATGALRQTFKGHTNWIWYVAFSPDGTELASTGIDGTVRIWDLAKQSARLTIRTEGDFLLWVNYSRDGRTLIGSDNQGKLRVWDRNTGSHLRMVQLDNASFWQPALSPDGRHIVACVSGELALLDYETLTITRRFASSIRGKWGMWAAAFSHNGQMLASCNKNRVDLYSLASGEVLGTLNHAHSVSAVDFSPDGHTVVTCDDANLVHVWDVERCDKRATLRGHESWVQMVRFSPDGKTIASSGNDGIIRLWRSTPGD